MSTEALADGATEAATAAVQAGQATSSIQIQIAPKHALVIGAGALAYVTVTKVVPWVKTRRQQKDQSSD